MPAAKCARSRRPKPSPRSFRTLPWLSKMRAGTKEKLNGSVTTADIAREIKKLTKHEVDKHTIEIAEPIRELGSHQVSIKLTKDTTATVNVVVEQEAKPEAKPEKKQEKKPAKKQAKKKETD